MDHASVDVAAVSVQSLGAPASATAIAVTRDNPLSAVTGLPAIVVPAGMTPDGFSDCAEMLGRPFSDRR